jgi:hypothetical protein
VWRKAGRAPDSLNGGSSDEDPLGRELGRQGPRRVRDIAIARQLGALADVEIDWIAPHPAGEFLERRGHRVLDCSSRLAGSGRVYQRVFAECTDEFNLMDYIRAESKLHRRDFEVSSAAWAAS